MTDALLTDPLLTDTDVIDLIARKAGFAPGALRRPTKICELGLRLEAYMAVLVEIEDRFDVEIDDLVGVDCVTLGGLMDCLKAKVTPPMAFEPTPDRKSVRELVMLGAA